MNDATTMPVTGTVPATPTHPSAVAGSALPVRSGGCGKCATCSCDGDKKEHSHEAK